MKNISDIKKKKQKLTRLIMLICLSLLPLFIWFESLLFKGNADLPISNNILIFALINLNVLLVLIIVFLILRNLAELLIEKKHKHGITKLKTKLVFSFLILSLVPTGILFFVSLQFVSTSMDYWFNAKTESSLQESLQVAQSVIKDKELQSIMIGNKIEKDLSSSTNYNLEKMLNNYEFAGLDSIHIIDGKNYYTIRSTRLGSINIPNIPLNTLQNVFQNKKDTIFVQETEIGDLLNNIRHLATKNTTKNHPIYLVTSILIEKSKLTQLTDISKGIENYRQLKYLKNPFKFWILVILLIVTLLIIFAAIWFGIYFSKSITNPLDKLAQATKRIADGNLDFVLEKGSDDEIGLLVDSFNTMTINLEHSNNRLIKAHTSLKKSSKESEDSRLYTEIILQNVTAGVISLDDLGVITMINNFASNLLKIDAKDFINKQYLDVLAKEHSEIITNFISTLTESGKKSLEKYLKLNIQGETFSLLVNFTMLEDANNNHLGYVLVFDNLTKIEKMQRAAAWREVAKRIAHEIKNPLTPIQLSAQRLRKKYPKIIAEDDKVFDKCTNTIINQVDEIKQLVSEFSQFARMPQINKSLNDIEELINKTIFLYKQAHKNITISLISDKNILPFYFDAEQIKRCIINLLDNAVAVLEDGGKIDITLTENIKDNLIILEIADNGPGIKEEDKNKIFEPYFSTKRTGTGLGLAITTTIITDHDGTINVKNRAPLGAIFTIKLPYRLTTII